MSVWKLLLLGAALAATACGHGRACRLEDPKSPDPKAAQACCSHEKGACSRVAAAYVRGNFETERPPEPDKAVAALEEGCGADDGAACLDLAKLVRLGLGAKQDPARAKSLYDKACRLGKSEACKRK